MTTYYDILGIKPEATIVEIETALETQYNRWRRLVTHHDLNMVTKANRALQVLEQARGTLTNPDKRAAYDHEIGLDVSLGGLADPSAYSVNPHPVPSSPIPKSSPVTTPIQRTDAWVCPKCNTANPISTRFCKSCGQQLGQNCPKCNALIEINATHCSACGINIEEFMREQQRQVEASEAEHTRNIERILSQAESELNQQLYGKAGDTLVAVKAYAGRTQNFDLRSRYEALLESIGILKKELSGPVIIVNALVYAVIGGIIGGVVGYEATYALIGAVIGAIVSAIIAAVYCNKWGGRRAIAVDYILSLLMSLAVIAIGSVAIYLIVVIIIVIVVIAAIGMFLGGG